MHLSPSFGRFAACALLVGVACTHAYAVKNYPTTEALFNSGMSEFNHKRWDNSVLAFEKLTLDLPARDSLLPKAYWYLAKSHVHKHQYLLAAQNFSRVTESFPDDSLADDALIEAGDAYAKMWRKPDLDAQYGLSALSTYRTMLAIYPNSSRRGEAEARAGKLEQWFATKDYHTGMYYFRRKAYDPAILYFRDVIRLYPNTPRTREAYLRLVKSFRAIRYRDDERETCTAVRQLFPTDREVGLVCGTQADSTALPSS